MLWRKKPHNQIHKNPNQLVTTVESQVTTETSVVNSKERNKPGPKQPD